MFPFYLLFCWSVEWTYLDRTATIMKWTVSYVWDNNVHVCKLKVLARIIVSGNNIMCDIHK